MIKAYILKIINTTQPIEEKYFIFAETAFNYVIDNKIDNFVIDTIYLYDKNELTN